MARWAQLLGLALATTACGLGAGDVDAPASADPIAARPVIDAPFDPTPPPGLEPARVEPIDRLRPPTQGLRVRPTPAPPARFPPDSEGCHWLFRQEHVPSFHLEISEQTWRLLEFDLAAGPERNELNLEDKPYHHLTSFRYEDVVFRDAQIRLRGNSNFWAGQGKMQFQISFDEDNRFQHFLGLRKILFDAAQFNRSFLRDRLSYAIARDAGLPAPCANNARVYVNGEYYGLFTHVEKIDAVFLWNRMVDPTGDLWKRANWNLRTNRDITDDARVLALRAAETYDQLDAVFEIGYGARVLAFEALLPAPDGAWAGGLNAYYYDDPHTGRFVHLPWDYDGAFTQSDLKYVDPLRWDKGERSFGRPFFDAMMTDPRGEAAYVGALEDLLENHYQPERLIALVDRWQAQIEPAMLEDENKPFTPQRHYERTDKLRAHLILRARFIRDWIDCHREGGMFVAEVGCGPAPPD